jgi:hypothetical protein
MGDWQHSVYTWHVKKLVFIDRSSIPDDTDHGPFFSMDKMSTQTIIFNAGDRGCDLLLCCICMHDDHHGDFSFDNSLFATRIKNNLR